MIHQVVNSPAVKEPRTRLLRRPTAAADSQAQGVGPVLVLGKGGH